MRARSNSAAKQHAEWLSLVEVSGPFLTLSILNESFKFGLDAHDSELYRSIREAYQEWDESQATAIHTAWIRFLLTVILGYPEEFIGEAQAIPESAVAVLELQGERIRPDLAILDPDDPRKVKLPILVYPRTQKLDSLVDGSSWSASPHTRIQMLLQNTGQQAGFVTNGAQWSLVHVRKGEPTGFATWHTQLLTEEKVLLQAFRGILGVESTLGAPEGKSLFDLLDKSAQDQEEVTKELGRQVRQAVEVFVNALDRLDHDSGRTLLDGIEPKEVYNAALTVMMRLIFLLCAEERGLMDQRELYVQHYSVSALSDQLLEEVSKIGNEDVLEHRHDAWMRLLATFRLVHSGCQHEDLNLPAYGGSLFDPSKYPFLERCQIDNRVTLHLMDALEFLQIRVPGGGREKRRLSFRALGVEQIGHVYEGLLDHTAVRAEEPVVGLTGKETEEAEVPLSVLEANRDDLGKFFKKAKIKVAGNVEKLLKQPLDMLKASKLRVACAGDEDLYQRVLPFLNLVREDSLDHLQVFAKGSLYVTQGTDRRASGTHYTPVSLTEEVVRYALEPQVYIGPAQGLPPSEWKLKSAREIIDLKVCDLAMGSGAFLVQACRYLSERLVEAWQQTIAKAARPLGFSAEGAYYTHPSPDDHASKGVGALVTTPIGNVAIADPSQELISDDADERLSQARRIVADRCLYGVDINPMAVEMAKLSLWLTTMRRDRPFTFLDHAMRVGDSLLGVSNRQLETFNMNPDGQYGDLLLPWVRPAIERAQALRAQLAKIPSHSPSAIRDKAHILERAKRELGEATKSANFLTIEALNAKGSPQFDPDRIEKTFVEPVRAMIDIYVPAGSAIHETVTIDLDMGRYAPFHWQLEFADVFANGGFDAIVGNPPFQGGQKITGALGTDYRDFLVSHIGRGKRGSADLCAYFFLRAFSLLKPSGTFGLLATNTISQGDTREVGLDQLVEQADTIYRAEKSSKWPGDANLEIAKVWVSKDGWEGEFVLERQVVPRITPFLDDGSASGKPFRLKVNEGLSFQGSIVLGMGFVMSPEEAQALIERDRRNKDVLFPYLNGEDLNSRPDQSPSRWVINFFDWPLGRVGQTLPNSGERVVDAIANANTKIADDWLPRPNSRWTQADEKRQQKWLQFGVVPDDFPGQVAADYPDCLEIVERLVRPERAKNNRDVRRLRWWQFAERAPDLYRTLAPLDRCLVIPETTKYCSFTWVDTGIVFSHMTKVVATDDPCVFATLNSNLHEVWARQYSSTLESRLKYILTDAFETFPLPRPTELVSGCAHIFDRSRAEARSLTNAGQTQLLNALHDSLCVDPVIAEVRNHVVSLDLAVRDAYGWLDLDLGHSFYGEGRDRRFTISPAARQEILRRLLKLNHERYAAEVAAGLHDKGSKPKRAPKPSKPSLDALSGPRRSLFDEQPLLGEDGR